MRSHALPNLQFNSYICDGRSLFQHLIDFSTSDGKECNQLKHEIKSNNLILVDQAAALIETN
jgi:hypothetical protein